MRRGIAVLWHAASLVLAVALYFFFVLPRWFELTGQWPHTLGTALRIVCGAVVALTALPVFFTWSRTRKPELGTPTLALSLRVWSMVAHVLAGLLIAGAGVSEIWLSLDTAGQWLFGIYGAAAAIALLGAFTFYLGGRTGRRRRGGRRRRAGGRPTRRRFRSRRGRRERYGFRRR